jgi:hypothetical protein
MKNVLIPAILIALILAFASQSVTLFEYINLHLDSKVWLGDDYHYRAMAVAPFQNFEQVKTKPFCYRILTPLLASWLPFDVHTNFYWITHIALFATSICFYFILKKLGFDQNMALFGIFFFLMNKAATGSIISQYCLVDGLNYFFIALAFYGMLCSNDMLVLWAVGIGSLNKETVLLLIPVYYIITMDKNGYGKTALRTILVFLPAMAFFLLLRHFIQPLLFEPTSPHSEGYRALFTHFLQKRRGTWLDYDYFLACWGILLPLALANLHSAPRVFKKAFIFFPVSYLQEFFASGVARLVFISFVSIIPLALLEVKRISSLPKTLRPVFYLALIFQYLYFQNSMLVILIFSAVFIFLLRICQTVFSCSSSHTSAGKA